MISTPCYRDLTTKTKFKGLTTTSWFILVILSVIVWFMLILYSIPVIALFYCVLFILEFFDEDIYEILYSKISISQNKFYA